MIILMRSFERHIDVSAGVVLWNYWDHEHLTASHSSWVSVKVLYETSELVVHQVTFRLPIFSFLKSTAVSVMCMKSPLHFTDFQQVLFGIPSITNIRIEEKGPDKCVVKTDYKFILKGWRCILAPFMKRMMASWNDRVWNEDLPLKIRRQKVLRHGFKDFAGMPEKLADRAYDGEIIQKLPIARTKGCPLDDLYDD